MPELPEVEAARRAVEDHCVGRSIRRAVVANDSKVVEGVASAEFEAALTGKTILGALRKGKNLWLRLDSPPFPSFQFGMTGAIYIKGVEVTKYKRSAMKSEDEWPSKYSKVFLELDDGLELSFTDKRRFARVRLLQDPESVPPISELGPDALLEPMELDKFVESLSSKKTPIKALLLDQNYIAGIGNWVADEVLYHARIHPLQIASSLSREQCEVLHRCIKEVVHLAVDVDADCSRFPVEWLFHFRWGKKSGKVNGQKIEFITAGGRTTAYVPEVQKLDGTNSGKASGRKSRKPRSEKSSGNEAELDSSEDNGREDADGVDKESHSRSKSKKGQRAAGGKKPLAKRSRASPDDKEQLVTEEGEEKEGLDREKRDDTRTPRSKKGQNVTDVTKKPPTKRLSRANLDEKGELGTEEAEEKEESDHAKPMLSKSLSATGSTKKPTAKKGNRSTPADKGSQQKKTGKGPAKEQMMIKDEASKKRTKADQTSMRQLKKRR